MARNTKVNLQFSFEANFGIEHTLDVSATITPYVPARIHPVDLSHDQEGGEIEDIELKLNGNEVELDDMIAIGLNADALDAAIIEAGHVMEACEVYDDYDDNYCPDYDDLYID